MGDVRDLGADLQNVCVCVCVCLCVCWGRGRSCCAENPGQDLEGLAASPGSATD